ncbi:MAG: ASKHA domain-containing protein [bacterium]
MSDRVRIELHPLGKILEVETGTPLRDALFEYGVEFPCGGRGRCRGCRIKVRQGSLPVTPEQARVLTPSELAEGWRLACQSKAEGALVLELAQWEAVILADETAFEFTPGEGLAAAVDLGTTTLVAQLVDRRNGQVRGGKSALNPQARHGSDIMSRIHFALAGRGQEILRILIRQAVGGLLEELVDACGVSDEPLREVVVAGNTAMHHLFCGIDVEPLAGFPFEPREGGTQTLEAERLGWKLPGNPPVRFLPCLGGFVGSDLLAGILATRIYASGGLTALIDLGTNGEIIVGGRDKILCASTAAGPAFEGGRISMGMRAATGAISEAWIENGALSGRVIGHGPPRGICGSGLVDAAAAALDLGWIDASGRLAGGREAIPVLEPVRITQADIRQLQLAKGAIAGGLRILLERFGATEADVSRLYLAGAFGNYMNPASARRIGLLDCPPERIVSAGNTSLLGTKMALFQPPEGGLLEAVRGKVEHVSLSADPCFQDCFVEGMVFEGK